MGGLVVFLLTGCLKEPIITKQSVEQRPAWVETKQFESKHYVYFTGSFRIDLHNPSFAYSRARKQFYRYLEQQADIILEPIKGVVSKEYFVGVKRKFVEFVSAELMLDVRREKTVYWEKVVFNNAGQSVEGYDYFVLLRLEKLALRRVQKEFIYKQYHLAKHLGKSLLYNQFPLCFDKLAQLQQLDLKQQKMLPNDLVL